MPESSHDLDRDFMAKRSNGKPSELAAPPSISRITVSGFKSIGEEQSIEIAPLTILAGANSSGKSGMMQPLLLLKQTLECPYDPGALLLDGPNVRFTSSEQFLNRDASGKSSDSFCLGVQSESGGSFHTEFEKLPGKTIDIKHTRYDTKEGRLLISAHNEILNLKQASTISWVRELRGPYGNHSELTVVRQRGFMKPAERYKEVDRPFEIFEITQFDEDITSLVHVPGLRGNPQRTYPVSSVTTTFPGTFEPYTASVIAKWESDRGNETLKELSRDLKSLGLTWKVAAKRINDAQVELQVGRLPKQTRGGSRDMVSIADVGFGVSQTLPVLVALHVAKPGQLVYLEQPEIHLHPRAQSAMAEVIANAAKRGVKVVVETHSNLLLLGVQTLVAEGKLDPNLVKLHWFQRNREGMTKITTGELDENGAFGDWPEDFADVSLNAEGRFLDAFGSKMGL